MVGNKDFWGTNVAAAVRPVVFDFIFNVGGAHKIKMEVSGQNRSSIASCKRAGMFCEGVLREEMPYFSGGRTDLHVFQCIEIGVAAEG